ncbi:hypothetical protein BDZ89DRAFT_1081720 [Hymenopellis radicata]|nr:hypothetical protein BDZ89DRAFT_1081720 [Hymenopellis radicata]
MSSNTSAIAETDTPAGLVDYEHIPHAISCLKAQFPPDNARKKLDPLLCPGAQWLGIESEGSQIWSTLLYWVLNEHHSCRDPHLNFPINLHILDLPKTDVPTVLPSLCEYLIHLAYPSSPMMTTFPDLPSDIRLHLTLIQSPFVHATKLSDSLMSKLVIQLRQYVNIQGERDESGESLQKHPDILPAIYLSLRVGLPGILENSSVALRDKQDLLHVLFRVLLLSDPKLYSGDKVFEKWISDAKATDRIVDEHDPIAYGAPLFTLLIAEALRFAVDSKSGMLAVKIYTRLSDVRWLEALEDYYMFNQGGEYRWWIQAEFAAYSFLAAAYTDGLSNLLVTDLEVYGTTLDYVKDDTRILILLKMFILSDVGSRRSLKSFVSLTQTSESWQQCIERLGPFLCSEDAKSAYERRTAEAKHPRFGSHTTQLVYEAFEGSEAWLVQLAGVVPQKDRTPTSRGKSIGSFGQWWRHWRNLILPAYRDSPGFQHCEYVEEKIITADEAVVISSPGGPDPSNLV